MLIEPCQSNAIWAQKKSPHMHKFALKLQKWATTVQVLLEGKD